MADDRATELRKELLRRELARRKQAAPSMVGDVVRSAGAGIRSGIEGLGGMAGDMARVQGDALGWVAGKFGASPEAQETFRSVGSRATPFFGMPDSEQVGQQTDALIGDTLKHDPQTTAGEYAKTAGEFLPAAAAGPGSFGRRLVTQALLPAAGSETAGQLTEGTAAEPYARVAGALAGGLAPSAARRAVSPLPISPERQALVDTLRREGVDLTAGQTTGRNALRYAESELGGNAGARMMEQQGEQFTSAALRRAGIDANRATPEVIDEAFTRIGQQFDDLGGRNRIVADQQLGQDLRATINEYGSLVPESARAPIVGNLTNDIVDAVRRNQGIPGDSYQALRSRLDKAARGARADPQLSEALRGLRNSLDDAMERSIAANNPDDAGAWREVRNQYRNMLVLEKAATGAGENAAQGIISPSQLRNATVTGQGRRNYARGQGDFSELARAGEGIMKPLPQSGTAPRTAVRNMGAALPAVLGAGAGGAAGGGAGALLGLAAGSALPPMVGRALLSGPGRAYLGNQAATGMHATDPRIAAVIAALLANRGQPAIAPPAQ